MTTVRLSTRGNVVEVRPWVPAILANPLTATRRRKNPEAARTKRMWLYDRIPMYAVQPDGSALTHLGLRHRIMAQLVNAGVERELVDEEAPLPKPVLSRLLPLRSLQPEVIATLCSTRCGVIDCATAFGKSFIITQLCRIYPKLKILVVSSAAPVVDSLYKRIKEDGGGRKVFKCDGAHPFNEDKGDVCVCTDKSLKKIPGDWPDLFLYDEVHEAAGPTVSQEILRFTKARRFGFSASPKGRSDLADVIVEALFGPVIMHVSYQLAEQHQIVCPIRVAMVDCVFNFSDDAFADITKKRWGYWRNKRRNQLVAAVANSFPANVRTLVFVETAEHAVLLKKLLPDYALVHGGIDAERWAEFLEHGWVTADDEALRECDEPSIREAFKKGEVTKVICTMRWKQGVDFPELPVVIRADGRTGAIPCTQIVGRLSRLSPEKPYGLLVDFKDQFAPWYELRAQKRTEVYGEKGWSICDWTGNE